MAIDAESRFAFATKLLGRMTQTRIVSVRPLE
jgi:hypothetical protein